MPETGLQKVGAAFGRRIVRASHVNQIIDYLTNLELIDTALRGRVDPGTAGSDGDVIIIDSGDPGWTNLAEAVRDTMGTALVAGANVTITPNDAGDTITIAASGGGGGSMSSFTLAGDTGTSQTINDANTATIAGGTGIDTVAGATDTVTVSIDSTVATLTGSQTLNNKTLDDNTFSSLQAFSTVSDSDSVLMVDASDSSRITAFLWSFFKTNWLQSAAASVFNESGADIDLRFEGDTDANLFFLDASTDRIGFGTATPSEMVHVSGTIAVTGNVDGRDVSADGAKLDGIEANADVTDAGNVAAAISSGTSVAIASGDFIAITDASNSNALAKWTYSQMITDLLTAFNSFYQSLDSDLTAIAGLSPSNDDIIQRKSGAWTNRTMAQLRADLGLKHQLTMTFDGGGSEIPDNQKAYLRVPFACTITGAYLIADVSGSMVVDVWKDTLANYPPTVADTITASAKPTISSSTKNGSGDTTLTGWTKTLAEGDILIANVDSCTTITHAVLFLTVTQTG